jgi:uncharacterized repeat protein (TIGR03803 family)
MSKIASWLAITAFGTFIALASAPLQGQSFKVLYTFKGGNDGAYPGAALTRDQNGTLYGTTSGGGKFSEGTVFKLDPDGRERVLYAFPGFVYGGYPFSQLLLDKAGNLYGTTLSGGGQFAELYGTVFKLASNGKLTNLVVFSGLNGINPFAGLIQDPAGNLYGTTNEGGPHAEGTVFELTKTGHQRMLHGFSLAPDGALPDCRLLRDEEGNLYGTTSLGGGTGDFGTVFEIDRFGKETILYRFLGGAEGMHPEAGLIRDGDGNLYGTTFGTAGLFPPFFYGTIFKLDPAGTHTLLYSFTGGLDGGSPSGGLVRDEAGNLYGGTTKGGSFNKGTVFMLDPNGKLTTLHDFTGDKDGSYPGSGLLLHEGRLFGTTGTGAAFNSGTVFRITLPGGDD